MNEKFGVVETFFRSVARPVSPCQRRGRHRAGGRAERDDVSVAVGRVVDHRVEVDERVVTGRVAVTGDCVLGLVLGVQGGMAARSRLAVGVVAHVLPVRLPGQPAADSWVPMFWTADG